MEGVRREAPEAYFVLRRCGRSQHLKSSEKINLEMWVLLIKDGAGLEAKCRKRVG
jgi:hypothetical protein